MSHDHYKKSVKHLDMIDVYRVVELFNVQAGPIDHAVKKLLCAGGRGHKDLDRDIQDAIDSLERWKEMRREDERADELDQMRKNATAAARDLADIHHKVLSAEALPGEIVMKAGEAMADQAVNRRCCPKCGFSHRAGTTCPQPEEG